MHFADRVVVHAPRERVWDFVLDPAQVAACFAQVERVERIDATHVRASVPVRVAFLSLRVTIDIELVEQAPPARAVFRIHATGPGSTVDGTAVVALGEVEADGTPGGWTAVEWSADVEPAGMAAAVGPQTIEREAEPVLRRAIDCLRRAVETP